MHRGNVYKALNRSIDAAVKSGRIDRDAQAALISVARKVACVMDEPDWPIVCKDADGKGKLDNVSPSVFLKYCEALGICPELSASDKKDNKKKLASVRSDMRVVGGKRAAL